MALCEVCGEKPAVKRVRLEGTVLDACEKCSRGGSELPRMPERLAAPKAVSRSFEGEALTLVPNFSKLVRNAREARELTREQVARELREKESVIARTERGTTPPIPVARKLEKFFKIKLLEIYEKKKFEFKESGDEDLTLGDVLRVK